MRVNGDARDIKRRLGVVSQENNLDPDLTVLKNLLVYGRYFGLPREQRLRRAEELLEFVQLEEKRDSHIRTLSGGMRPPPDAGPRAHLEPRAPDPRRADAPDWIPRPATSSGRSSGRSIARA